MAWDDRQVKLFVREVLKNCGDGWRFFTPEVREAFISQKALAVIAGQASETVRTEDVCDLRTRMRVEAGLYKVTK
jgi:hypothetical protein